MQESNAGSVPANESQQHLQQGRRILLLTEGEGGEDGSGGWGVGIQLPWVCQNTNIKQQQIETLWGPFLVFIGSTCWLYDYPTSFLHLVRFFLHPFLLVSKT